MTAPNKLTLAEELVLIALDDESGSLLSLPPFSLEVLHSKKRSFIQDPLAIIKSNWGPSQAK
jgi:hypothetical protein